MTSIKLMINYLSDNPHVGAISGISSGVFLTITNFLTDETVLKMIGACGVWLGFIIAIMTGIIKLYELMKLLKIKMRK
jgi:hypothetical protein